MFDDAIGYVPYRLSELSSLIIKVEFKIMQSKTSILTLKKAFSSKKKYLPQRVSMTNL